MIAEHVLPICENPIVKENYLGLIYSVFQASPIDLTPVLSNYYINIVSGESEKTKYSHLFEDRWLMSSGITHRQHFVLHKELYENKVDELLRLIQTLIAADYYLVGNNDAFYIRSKFEYGRIHTSSVFLIYGFSSSKEVFYSIGKTGNSPFAKYEISYGELIESLFNHKNGAFYLDFYNYNDNFEVKPDLSKIYNGIVDYIDSTKKGVDILRKTGKTKYGLDCYRCLEKSLSYVGEYVTYIDPLEYNVFLEHHILMSKRLSFLESQDIISSEIVAQYESVTQTAKKTYTAILAYNKELNPAILSEIAENVHNIISDEDCVLRLALENIKKTIVMD